MYFWVQLGFIILAMFPFPLSILHTHLFIIMFMPFPVHFVEGYQNKSSRQAILQYAITLCRILWKLTLCGIIDALRCLN